MEKTIEEWGVQSLATWIGMTDFERRRVLGYMQKTGEFAPIGEGMMLAPRRVWERIGVLPRYRPPVGWKVIRPMTDRKQ